LLRPPVEGPSAELMPLLEEKLVMRLPDTKSDSGANSGRHENHLSVHMVELIRQNLNLGTHRLIIREIVMTKNIMPRYYIDNRYRIQ
jgi:hypothetical protein